MSYSSVFGDLHQGHFRLFASASAPVMAELVTHLDKTVFTFSIEPIRKKAAQAAIREFLDARNWSSSFTDDGEPAPPEDEPPHIAAYSRLVRCGWLVEIRDGLRTVVDLDGTARLFLQTLHDIQSGRLRSFGGEVLQC